MSHQPDEEQTVPAGHAQTNSHDHESDSAPQTPRPDRAPAAADQAASSAHASSDEKTDAAGTSAAAASISSDSCSSAASSAAAAAFGDPSWSHLSAAWSAPPEHPADASRPEGASHAPQSMFFDHQAMWNQHLARIVQQRDAAMAGGRRRRRIGRHERGHGRGNFHRTGSPSASPYSRSFAPEFLLFPQTGEEWVEGVWKWVVQPLIGYTIGTLTSLIADRVYRTVATQLSPPLHPPTVTRIERSGDVTAIITLPVDNAQRPEEAK